MAAQRKLIDSYFSESGIRYSLCRVPIGGSDFSLKAYSYDDNFDPELDDFTLQSEDFKYKIPYIQEALKLTNNDLKLFASPWTAPPWMKTNNDWTGIGFLQTKYYQLWADYFIKFFDEYQANGINFWGMTTQNEPLNGFIPGSLAPISAMGWIPHRLDNWIVNNMGPTLRRSAHKNVKIIVHDDQRLTLPFLAWILLDEEAMRYVDGVAVHWYSNIFVPSFVLKFVKSPFRDIFVLATEACNGYLHTLGIGEAVAKGSWDRGEKYITDILENLQNGVAGWVDWNMALDETGGPNYIKNFVDSPILVNATLGEFYKQPMFYALGHFSKFILPGSVRVETTLSLALRWTSVQAMAFLRPDKITAVVIYNSGGSSVNVEVEDNNHQIANLDIEAHSINTLLFKD